MKYDPQKHHRQTIRLQGYDYTSPGAYFITICTHQRQCLFGEIVDGEMQLSEFGQCINAHWNRLPTHFPHIQLDKFVVMPNHIHGILTFPPNCRGAALDKNRSHPTDNLHPNATPGSDKNRSHPADNLHPNATPGSDKNRSHLTDNLHPNSIPDSAKPLIESEPGVAFGRGMGATGMNGLPNAAPLRAGSVGAVVLNFKSVTTRRINQMRKVTSMPVWQRNYYEHIIRNDIALANIRQYIDNNPRSWQQDQLRPNNPSK